VAAPAAVTSVATPVVAHSQSASQPEANVDDAYGDEGFEDDDEMEDVHPPPAQPVVQPKQEPPQPAVQPTQQAIQNPTPMKQEPAFIPAAPVQIPAATVAASQELVAEDDEYADEGFEDDELSPSAPPAAVTAAPVSTPAAVIAEPTPVAGHKEDPKGAEKEATPDVIAPVQYDYAYAEDFDDEDSDAEVEDELAGGPSRPPVSPGGGKSGADDYDDEWDDDSELEDTTPAHVKAAQRQPQSIDLDSENSIESLPPPNPNTVADDFEEYEPSIVDADEDGGDYEPSIVDGDEDFGNNGYNSDDFEDTIG
jgi:hypothetical protein